MSKIRKKKKLNYFKNYIMFSNFLLKKVGIRWKFQASTITYSSLSYIERIYSYNWCFINFRVFRSFLQLLTKKKKKRKISKSGQQYSTYYQKPLMMLKVRANLLPEIVYTYPIKFAIAKPTQSNTLFTSLRT